MYAVAVTELGGPIDATAAALAGALGTTAYEERMNLAAGLPAIVLTTPDPALATALVEWLRARGDGAIRCDTADVIASSTMVSLRRFRFEEDDLVSTDPGETRLPYHDVAVMLRARHRRRTDTSSTITERRFALGRAIASGGLILSRNATRTIERTSEEDEQVLYIFRRGGATPWLLRENGTHYSALGPAMTHSSHQNFVATVEQLRQKAPRAAYDERLLALRNVPQRITHAAGVSGRSTEASSESGIDLLAHLVARWLAGGAEAASPYRP